MPTLTRPKSKPKGQATRTSSVWHIRFYDPLRRRTRIISTRCRRRRNAEKRLREFCDLLELGRYDGSNPFLVQKEQQAEDFGRLQLPVCVADFETDLRSGQVRKRGKGKPPTEDHCNTTLARLRRVLDATIVTTVDQLNAESVASAVQKLCDEGQIGSDQTRVYYERAVKSFATWLCSSGVLPHDPLARLGVSEVTRVVHERGAFTMEQVRLICQAARKAEPFRGLTGEQRALLYLTMAGTGLRVRESAAVRKQDFGPDLATVTVAGCFTKNDKPALQPLPGFVRQALLPYVSTLGDEDFLWPGGWQQDEGQWQPNGWVAGKEGGVMLRRDAAKVGIVIGREGAAANGGKVLDAHSFRHAFATLVDRAGVSERLARKLARASSGALLDRYTHRDSQELAAAVAAFPTLAWDD